MAKIVLACGASVAIYKACDLASKLAQRGHQVRAVLTPRATKLVRPQLFEAVTGEPASSSEWGKQRRAAMDHIDLAKWCDAMVVAPLTASLAARIAHGLGEDLVTTVALALPRATPRLAAPTMNPAMLEAPPIQRALALMRADGWDVMEPDEGWMACGDVGKGRFPEVAKLVERLDGLLRR